MYNDKGNEILLKLTSTFFFYLIRNFNTLVTPSLAFTSTEAQIRSCMEYYRQIWGSAAKSHLATLDSRREKRLISQPDLVQNDL